jgi:hypothetical protein
MRETRLERSGQELRLRTDDRGTQLRDADDRIIAEYGTDQHERLIEEHRQQGWQPVREGDRRPRQAGEADPNQRPGMAVRSDGEDG